MVGINVPVPVPMAYYSLGGWKNSLFGDAHAHAHGADGVHSRPLSCSSRPPAAVQSVLAFSKSPTFVPRNPAVNVPSLFKLLASCVVVPVSPFASRPPDAAGKSAAAKCCWRRAGSR